jgi:hypothetical protein
MVLANERYPMPEFVFCALFDSSQSKRFSCCCRQNPPSPDFPGEFEMFKSTPKRVDERAAWRVEEREIILPSA